MFRIIQIAVSRKKPEEVLVNKKFFLLCLAVIMTLACGAAAVSAVPVAQWDSTYCYYNYCGTDPYFNNNYGYYNNYCIANYKLPYQAAFVKDITIPDGAYVGQGQTFTKTWRIRNVGTYTWTTNMALVYYGGDQMGAPSCINLPYNVSPGYYVDISVPMTAPSIPTSTKGEWMLRTPDGTLFGVGCNGATPVWVSINTTNSNSGCACYSPTGCTTPCIVSAANNTTTRAGRNPFCNNKIRTVKDITIPDGTVVAPGATFRKTWSMKNGGTCVWDGNYVLTQIAGDNLGGPDIVSVTASLQPNLKYTVNRPSAKVYPGETVQISIDLVAPTKPGRYEAYYRLRDNYGYEFGYGSYADEAFWVSIVVSDSVSKSAETEEADLISKGTETTDAALIEIEEPKAEVPVAEVTETASNKCGEQSVAMRATETGYTVIWNTVNAGTSTWENYTLVNSDANPAVKLASDEAIVVPTTAPGESAEVTFDIDLDANYEGTDPLWMEFYMNSGSEGFCEFYFEAPAKAE